MIAAGVRGIIHFGAANFALPATAWLTGSFWQYFRAQLWNADVDKWQVKWECRDFARAYATLAQLCNARTSSSPADTDALAVGEFWYNPGGDRTKGHAINACFTERGLTFIEPQTGNPVQLCPVEIQSCYFCRF
jgi:hypothetical protein